MLHTFCHSRPLVVFRVDASIEIGTGHVMRCLTLAEALEATGASVHFICRAHVGHLIDLIQAKGFEVTELPADPDWIPLSSEAGTDTDTGLSMLYHASWLETTLSREVTQCRSILQRLRPDWLVVDHYALDLRWERALQSTSRKLMVIDDLGDRKHQCDLLLDQNYGARPAKYSRLVPETCRMLLGTDYALLRPEFAQWRPLSLARRQQVRQVRTILVTLGGVDRNNVTVQVLRCLSDVPLTLKVIVVMGSKAPHLDEVRTLAETLPLSVQVRTNVQDMARLMSQVDMAIGAAGATSWERCCLGLPTVQLVIADNQKEVAKHLAQAKAAKSIDSLSQLSGLVIRASGWMPSVSQHASGICDGRGVQRVLQEM